MRNTKKTTSRPVQVTAPLNVPPTKLATPFKNLTLSQQKASIKKLEKEIAEHDALLQANELKKSEALQREHFIKTLPKEAIIYSHSGAVLLNIKTSQAYDLYNQLSNMFHKDVFDLRDETKTIFEMLKHSVENAKDNDWAGEYVRVCKEWINTLNILHTIHQHTQISNQ